MTVCDVAKAVSQTVIFFVVQFCMAIKRMTLEQLEAARRRAVSMMENFGDSDGAAEFDVMDAETYAQHKGIEVINSNPQHTVRRTKIMAETYTKKQYKTLIEYISGIVEGAFESNSRTDMRTTLEEISDLTDADATLLFDEDGTVRIEDHTSDEEADDEDDDEDE
jgi:hypothetical protein